MPFKTERPQDIAVKLSPIHLGSPDVFHAKYLLSLSVRDVGMVYLNTDNISKQQESLWCSVEIH